MFELIRKRLDRSDEDFLKELSSLPRRRLELERLRRQRAGSLSWMGTSIFIVVFGILYNIFGHGNLELSFFANVQYNIAMLQFQPILLFWLFLFVVWGIRFKCTDFQIKTLLLFEKTQPQD